MSILKGCVFGFCVFGDCKISTVKAVERKRIKEEREDGNRNGIWRGGEVEVFEGIWGGVVCEVWVLYCA